MGIPKLFRWLTDQYPVISQRLDQGLNEVRPSFGTGLAAGFLLFNCCWDARAPLEHDPGP